MLDIVRSRTCVPKDSSQKIWRNVLGRASFTHLRSKRGPSLCSKTGMKLVVFMPLATIQARPAWKQHGLSPSWHVMLLEIVHVCQGLLPKILTKCLGENRFFTHLRSKRAPAYVPKLWRNSCFYAFGHHSGPASLKTARLRPSVGMRDIVQLRIQTVVRALPGDRTPLPPFNLNLTRRESSGGMEWLGYGIAIFRALNFQILEPEIWQTSLFLRNFRDFPGKFGLWKIFFGLWKMAIPCATNPYPH